jgi:Fe-S cluster assembly protein SufB
MPQDVLFDELSLDDYKYGFRDPDSYVFKSERGLSRRVVEQISAMKEEPEWMLKRRLKALEIYESKPVPTWGGDLSRLDMSRIYFYVRPAEQESRSWDEVPEDIKRTFDRLGIP